MPFPSQIHSEPFFTRYGKHYMRVDTGTVGYNPIKGGTVIIPKDNGIPKARHFDSAIEAYTTLNKEALQKDN